MSEHKRIHKILVSFALGELSPKAQGEVRKHLFECSECTIELKRLKALLEFSGCIREISVDNRIRQSAKQAILTTVKSGKMKQSSMSNTGLEVIWRTIVKSKIAKLAVAALIVIVVILAFKDGSIDIVSSAFGIDEVIASMQKVEWMHATVTVIGSTNADSNRMENKYNGSQHWQSIHPHRKIDIYSEGSIYFEEEQTLWKYDSDSNTITITYHDGSIPDREKPKNLQDVYLTTVSYFESKGATVEYSTGTYDGCPIQIIKVDHTDENGFDRKMMIKADAQTRLAKEIEIYQKTSKNENSTFFMIFDYPSSGPKDIYEAGAPCDAKVKVIDLRDKPELVEALKPYNKARENLFSDYILITAHKSGLLVSGVEVIYNQGRKQRSERPTVRIPIISGDDDLEAYEKALGDSAESLLEWARDNKGRTLEVGLYDGEYYYHAVKDSFGRWTLHEKIHRPECNPIPFEDLRDVGWPGIPPKVNVKKIENDYSKEHNLIAFEIKSESEIRNGKIFVTAKRAIFYLNPTRDYMSVREEKYYHILSGSLGSTKVIDVHFDPNDIPDEPGWVRCVCEFGQTEKGQWYPKRTEQYSKRSSLNGNVGPLRLSGVCTLIANPVFPEGIFDPEKLLK